MSVRSVVSAALRRLPCVGGLWLASALACLSCAPKPPARFNLLVQVESDPGQPVAAAELTLDGQRIAQSDARGHAAVVLHGAQGEIREVQVACPSGYRSPDRPLRVVLRPFLDGRQPEYKARCRPLLQNVVVAVRAQFGADLPLRYLGKEIARTDASGVCHALLKLSAGERATLTLDTSAPQHARLLPRSPELTINVPERDELVIFDQTFSREPEPKQSRRRTRLRPSGPIRI